MFSMSNGFHWPLFFATSALLRSNTTRAHISQRLNRTLLQSVFTVVHTHSCPEFRKYFTFFPLWRYFSIIHFFVCSTKVKSDLFGIHVHIWHMQGTQHTAYRSVYQNGTHYTYRSDVAIYREATGSSCAFVHIPTMAIEKCFKHWKLAGYAKSHCSKVVCTLCT